MSKNNCMKDKIWNTIKDQSMEIMTREPLLQSFIHNAILQHSNFIDALIYRLAAKLGGKIVTTEFLSDVFHDAYSYRYLSQETANDKNNLQDITSDDDDDDDVEQLAMKDLVAVEQRDPACKSIAQVFLYFKGYKSIQTYRFAHLLWKQNRIDLAMLIQARCTEVFGVDIHPAAQIQGGLMIDHGTGVVIGETCVIGANCSFLHGVTLGGTGKSTVHDRHPKLGNNVFVGCQATILGNIHIGDNAVIGSGSLLLKAIPNGAVAVGSPAIVKYIDTKYLPVAVENTVSNDQVVTIQDTTIDSKDRNVFTNNNKNIIHEDSDIKEEHHLINQHHESNQKILSLWSNTVIWEPKSI